MAGWSLLMPGLIYPVPSFVHLIIPLLPFQPLPIFPLLFHLFRSQTRTVSVETCLDG